MRRTMRFLGAAVMAMLVLPGAAGAQSPHWATSWAASVQGPYPVGNPSAQPNLSFAIPSATAGFRDQTLRLMVRPALWGPQTRLRFSNALGTQPVTLDGVFAGLQQSGSVLEPNSNQPVNFGGKPAGDDRARPIRVERPGGPAVRAGPGGPGAGGQPHGGQPARGGGQRAGHLARQGAHHVLHHAAGLGLEGQHGRRAGFPVQHGVLVLPGRDRYGGGRRGRR